MSAAAQSSRGAGEAAAAAAAAAAGDGTGPKKGAGTEAKEGTPAQTGRGPPAPASTINDPFAGSSDGGGGGSSGGGGGRNGLGASDKGLDDDGEEIDSPSPAPVPSAATPVPIGASRKRKATVQPVEVAASKRIKATLSPAAWQGSVIQNGRADPQLRVKRQNRYQAQRAIPVYPLGGSKDEFCILTGDLVFGLAGDNGEPRLFSTWNGILDSDVPVFYGVADGQAKGDTIGFAYAMAGIRTVSAGSEAIHAGDRVLFEPPKYTIDPRTGQRAPAEVLENVPPGRFAATVRPWKLRKDGDDNPYQAIVRMYQTGGTPPTRGGHPLQRWHQIAELIAAIKLTNDDLAKVLNVDPAEVAANVAGFKQGLAGSDIAARHRYAMAEQARAIAEHQEWLLSHHVGRATNNGQNGPVDVYVNPR